MSTLIWQCCTLLMNIEPTEGYNPIRVLIRKKKDRESIYSVRIGSYFPEEKEILVDSGDDDWIETEYLNLYEYVMVKDL